MISKHITCKVENDNYRKLANYIADASHKGEKCLFSWCEGAWNSDNYELAIREVEATQQLNARTKKEKTYHLLVSFRMEDEEKLNAEDFKAIEKRFAEILGYSEHQRHCGVHINTENIHMHIAYNMIHIDKLTRHEPFQDFKSRDILCRQLEREYELSIDNGIDPFDDSYKLSQSSSTKESLTGEESFERFVITHKTNIMKDIRKAQTWECVHKAFALYGLEIKQRANGLAIKNKKGKQYLKASKFDRSISFTKMLDRFGIFQEMKQTIKAKTWYKRKPLTVDYSHKLWKEFIKTQKNDEITKVKEKWLKEKIRITGLALTRKSQFELLKKAKLDEKLEINQLRQKFTVSSSNWLSFLQEKAQAGDDESLELLRTKNHRKLPYLLKTSAFGEYKDKLQKQEEKLKKDNKVIISNQNHDTKKTLLAVNRIKAITNEKFIYRITRTGIVVFEFESGKKIIDRGYATLKQSLRPHKQLDENKKSV